MLLSAGLPAKDDGQRTDEGDGRADAEGDGESSGGYNLYCGPYDFTPGALRTIALKLAGHCDIFACPCKLGTIREDWAMQTRMFRWVDGALARCLNIPGFERIEMELTPNSNTAWFIKDWKNVARKLLPPFFPKTADTGRLHVKEFARWPYRGTPDIDEGTLDDGDIAEGASVEAEL
ncbi:uncharacterized protein PHACADRAFT_248754 [Phanerochaete carnosa HHB-10118-sp]|uniref:Uncharacterized protein n=1 Tax=Phanerochaete carnosa (strain HHB-10118-sp) TaxID=650164 RepID=K5XFL2_PHACS|nr:uncharacterized protein PHACADRAFT_248754 [Phanerochaete carnosa HHB-10118-sp]EKM61862.1 hypothetical protein PHACADRAFT_248754 [Phanerochaete carnosa HHB-10118-sp]